MALGTKYGVNIRTTWGTSENCGNIIGETFGKTYGIQKETYGKGHKLGTTRKKKGTSGKTCDIKIKEYMCGDLWKQHLRKI